MRKAHAGFTDSRTQTVVRPAFVSLRFAVCKNGGPYQSRRFRLPQSGVGWSLQQLSGIPTAHGKRNDGSDGAVSSFVSFAVTAHYP